MTDSGTPIFADTLINEKSADLAEEYKPSVSLIKSLAAEFRRVAQTYPKKNPLWRRAVDTPSWTENMMMNTARYLDVAASALIHGDKKICQSMMFHAKRDFEQQSRRHKKASKFILVGKPHVTRAHEFQSFADKAAQIVNNLL